MSGLFKSTVIKGTKITDFAQTSATVGNVIPFGYGKFRTDGNIAFAALPPKENRTVKRQGKGGVKNESFIYTMSYAVAFCRGPIQGFLWIKRNGKVVYSSDPNAPIEDVEYSAKWLEKATIYLGSADQLPDSTIESYKGSGRVSAMRFIAYIVIEEEDVTDGGGAIPSYEAVPIATPPEAYLTSKPYAQFYFDSVATSARPTGGSLVKLLYETDMQPDNVGIGLGIDGGDLFEVPPPEIIDDVYIGILPTGGGMFVPPPQYTYDKTNIGLLPTSGTLKVPPLGTRTPDAVDESLTPTGGALYVP